MGGTKMNRKAWHYPLAYFQLIWYHKINNETCCIVAILAYIDFNNFYWGVAPVWGVVRLKKTTNISYFTPSDIKNKVPCWMCWNGYKRWSALMASTKHRGENEHISAGHWLTEIAKVVCFVTKCAPCTPTSSSVSHQLLVGGCCLGGIYDVI